MILIASLLSWSQAAELYTCGDSPTEGCYPTIQAAVDAAADGDVVYVTNGVYREAVTITNRELSMGNLGEDDFAFLLGPDVEDDDDAALTIDGGQLILHQLNFATTDVRPIRVLGGADVTLESIQLTSAALPDRSARPARRPAPS